MSVRRGDVVLLQAPFTSGAGAQSRPMLVVQNDANNARMANTILVFITTNLARSSEPTQGLRTSKSLSPKDLRRHSARFVHGGRRNP
jgi:mRNA-degrading endonuclease toxin of MazEF toxin-antitoxin module